MGCRKSMRPRSVELKQYIGGMAIDFEMDTERFIATKAEGPKSFNGTKMYVSSNRRSQKHKSTILNRKGLF